MDHRRKIATVGGLVLLSCLVQVWTISRAVVPAQDCVRYLIVAQGIECDGLTATLRSQPEQPLFPAMAWLVHRVLAAVGFIDVDTWAICLQVAAALPLILSVMPVHALFCRLHGKSAAAIAALLYCLLGGVARLGADGLSDSTHLALICLALWAAVRYFPASPATYGSPAWLLLCGAFTGLALTARSEAIVLPVAVPATLLLLQIFSAYRQLWLRMWRATCAFLLGLTAVLAPYLAICNTSTTSAALARLTGRRGAAEAAPLNSFESNVASTAVEPRWDLPGTGRLVFGKKDVSTTTRFRGYCAATIKLTQELAQTLHYWIGAFALVGLWTARCQRATPLDRFMQCLCATLVTAVVGVAAEAGYLSTRHVLLLVVLAIGWAGVGALAIAGRTEFIPFKIFHWLRFGARGKRHDFRSTTGRLSWLVAVVIAAGCLPDLFAPLHASRTAHREAARWLAKHAGRSDAVLDSRGWTALYTGRKTYRYEAAQAAFSDPALSYVVVEQAELTSSSRRSETLRLLVAQAGEVAARLSAGSEKHGVVIHRWRPERFRQLGVQSYAR